MHRTKFSNAPTQPASADIARPVSVALTVPPVSCVQHRTMPKNKKAAGAAKKDVEMKIINEEPEVADAPLYYLVMSDERKQKLLRSSAGFIAEIDRKINSFEQGIARSWSGQSGISLTSWPKMILFFVPTSNNTLRRACRATTI